MERVRQLLKEGRTAEAEAELEVQLQSVANPGRWRLLAALRGHRGDHSAEADALAEAAKGDAAAVPLLAQALLDAGRPQEALETAAQAVRAHDSLEARRLFVDALTSAPKPAHRDLIGRAVCEGWGRAGRLFRPALKIIQQEGLGSDLLPVLLRSGPVHDADLERELTALRRRYLLESSGPLLGDLAEQCWINEYCWNVTEEEHEALAGLPQGSPLLAMYENTRPEPEPLDIPAITAIRPGVSEAVRGMYEANPYPRWVRLPDQERRPIEWVLRRIFPLATLDPIPGASILVAGCGTGQHALQVARRFEGEVLAVDLSLASLDYAKRKARQLGVGNVTFAQADLLELAGGFDVVSCTGTLQAMADPYEGQAALLRLLKPGGLLHLGLYSRSARAELAPAMDFAKWFEPTPEGIRAMRAAIMAASEGDPRRAAQGWSDFYSTSAVRDLLMHVMEHQSEIADVRRMTEGLRFLGFQAPPDVMATYRAENPADPAGIDLDQWEAFEQRHPTAFRGMYQFWAQKPL